MAEAESWASGAAYEPFIGRWSRLIAYEFLRWLPQRDGERWVEVGCGSGSGRGSGRNGAHLASLDARRREALRERLRARLPTGPSGQIELRARAWAVRGRRAAVIRWSCPIHRCRDTSSRYRT